MTDKMDFFARYNTLAAELVEDTETNLALGVPDSNAELAVKICTFMEWESFSLLAKMDFQAIYDGTNLKELLAHAYLAFLRLQLFSCAEQMEIGETQFNEMSAAHSEYWYLKLIDKFDAVDEGRNVTHEWLH